MVILGDEGQDGSVIVRQPMTASCFLPAWGGAFASLTPFLYALTAPELFGYQLLGYHLLLPYKTSTALHPLIPKCALSTGICGGPTDA